MDINTIISSIPNVIAGLYEAIFVLDGEVYYQVKYDGDELIVSVPYELKDLASVFENYNDDVFSSLTKEGSLKRVYETKDGLEKLVVLTTFDSVKIVLITDTTFISKVTDGKAKLLIADDSNLICNFFKKALGEEFEVLVASDGNEAIKIMEDNKDNNLLGAFIDLNMPNKDGYEVLEYMRNGDLMGRIPVSVISGEDSAESIEKVISLGAVDMLQKPFNADAARAIVNKTISLH